MQRAYYNEGRITIDRVLDAVDKNAKAIASKARYKAAYNLALTTLGEAKGTLLTDRDVTIAEVRKTFICTPSPDKARTLAAPRSTTGSSIRFTFVPPLGQECCRLRSARTIRY